MTTTLPARIAALAILCAPVELAAAPQPACLTHPEVEALLSALAPTAIAGAAERCRAALPANAYLTRSGAALAQRLRPLARSSLPVARVAFGKVAGTALPPSLKDDLVLGLIEAGVTDALIGKLKIEDCARVDRLLAPLDPLPPRNFAMLIAALGEIGFADKAGDIKLCPSDAAR